MGYLLTSIYAPAVVAVIKRSFTFMRVIFVRFRNGDCEAVFIATFAPTQVTGWQLHRAIFAVLCLQVVKDLMGMIWQFAFTDGMCAARSVGVRHESGGLIPSPYARVIVPK
jgi:hypothetical protein